MRNNALDDIIKCTIEISAPASNDATFDTILLVVAAPTGTASLAPSGVVAIGRADELLEYGFAITDPAYKAATVAFSQNPAPSKLLICVRQKEDDVYESITTTLIRANAEADFYGIHLTSFKDSGDIQATVSWAEANEKLFFFEYTDIESFPVENPNFYRTAGAFSGLAPAQPAENDYAALAWMAKCFGYQPGTETWNMKSIATIAPSALTTSQKEALTQINATQFLRYAGDNISIGGKTLAGEWIDVIRFRDWLKAEMQTRVFNVLKVNRKVPFTDDGIGLIEGAMEATLLKGQTIGGIAPTEYDADGNEIPGFTVTVPRASELTEAERKSRKLTGCKYTARLAGAIHLVEIEGFLTF